MDSIRPTADLRGVELIADLPEPGGDDDIALRIDPVRIQQVVWNLLSNAIKFTPRGGRVNISLGREGGVVRLVVRDSGRGIPPAFLPYVFDRFRQAESPLNRDYGGLGLGLAICRHLVEAHDGTIRAQSPGPGEGATFTVELPIHTPPPPSTALMKRT